MRKLSFFFGVFIFSTLCCISADCEQAEKTVTRWGYVNQSNETVIPFEYETAKDFSNGLAHVVKDKHSFFIDKTGRKIADTPGDRFASSYYSEGLAPVLQPGGWGFLDKDGRVAIAGKYSDVGPFSEGLAAVELGRDNVDFVSTDAKVPQPGKIGYIDKRGKLVIAAKYQVDGESFYKVSAFHDGLARVRVNHYYGFIDSKGKMVIEPKFSDAGNFSNGFAEVIGKGTFGWVYINTKGAQQFSIKNTIPPQLMDVQQAQFSEGLAIVEESSHLGEEGAIDLSGRYVFKVKKPIRLLFAFSSGYAVIVVEGEKRAYVDKTGKQIGELTYDEARQFSNGLGAVKIDGKWGFIGGSGEFAIPPQYDEVRYFRDGLVAVAKTISKP